MTRSQLKVLAALSGLSALGLAGCQSSPDDSAITPKHPVPLSSISGIASKPGKGGMVGGLPQGAAPSSSVNPEAATANTVGSKAH